MTQSDGSARGVDGSGPPPGGQGADRQGERAARDLGAELADALEADVSSGFGTEEAEASAAGPSSASARDTILLAWSGGLDSTVLLHLLLSDERVAAATGDARIVAAHLDHGMRSDSAAAAAAARRTAEEWGVEYRTHRLSASPESEADARTRRYAWLTQVADEVAAREIWTAHHADDQAETVLFRVVRGTGVAGLAGIPVRRGRLRRPFLMLPRAVWRDDLRRYAERRKLPVLSDPSNEEPVATRNRLRNEAIPLLSEIVPGAAAALVRLGRNASRAADEAEALVDLALEFVRDAEEVGAPDRGAQDRASQDRGARDRASREPPGIPARLWGDAGRPLRRALVRQLAKRSGTVLSEAATAAVLDLPADSQSGRGVDLPGGLRFEREFDHWRLFRSTAPDLPADRRERVEIQVDGSGKGRAWFGTRPRTVVWTTGTGATGDAATGSAHLQLPASRFPLTIRAWEPGDRIARSFGTTAVAKLWSETRVPRRERTSRWVLVDRDGTVVAAEGLGAARLGRTIEGSSDTPVTLHLRLDVEE